MAVNKKTRVTVDGKPLDMYEGTTNEEKLRNALPLQYPSNASKGKKNNIKPGLLQKWMGSFKDDKGVFQGGSQKRFLGRLRDDLELKFGGTKAFDRNITQLGDTEGSGDYQAGVSTSRKGQRSTIKESHPKRLQAAQDIRKSANLTEKAGYDMYVRNLENNPDFQRRVQTDLKDQPYEVPAYSKEFTQARAHALDFDVTDKNSVMEMQRLLNNAGIKDSEGKELAVDGILGDKTTNALKSLQGKMIYEKEYAQRLITQKRINEQKQRNNALELGATRDLAQDQIIDNDIRDKNFVKKAIEDDRKANDDFDKEYALNERYHELERYGAGGRKIMNRHIHKDKAFREYVKENHPKKYDRYKATYGTKAHGYKAPEESDGLYMGPEDEEYLKGAM